MDFTYYRTTVCFLVKKTGFIDNFTYAQTYPRSNTAN